MQSQFLLFISAMVLSVSVNAQFPTYIQDAFQEQFDDFAAQHNLVGLSIAIKSANHTWTAVDGISTANDPIADTDLFAMGSVSKTITAATILQMADDGLLSLDDEVGDHLPLTPWVTPTITIRQLLNHTTGLFNYTQHPNLTADVFYNSSNTVTALDVLSNYMQNGPFSPGQDWAYSNTNYLVLGMIVESVAGQAHYLEARDRFDFDTNYPSFSMPPHESSTDNLAHLWMDTIGNGTYFDWQAGTLSTNMLFTSAGAAGAYVGTPTDLAQWMYDLHSGMYHQTATLQDMTTIVANSDDYGLGTEINDGPCNQTSYGHTGGIYYRSASFYSPTCDLSVAIQTNDANVPVDLEAYILDVFCTYSEIVGLQEASEIQPKTLVYPNPTAGTIQIDGYDRQMKLQLISSTGQLSKPAISASGEVDLSDVAPGVYVLRISTPDRIETARLVVQR